MLIHSEGIVLNHIRFAENDLIVRILTKQKGLISFLIKNGLKKKKKYLQQLMVINLSFHHKTNKNLHYIKSIEFKTVSRKILTNYQKRNAVLFLCEVISRCIKSGYEDIYLYNFIEKSIDWLNSEYCSGKFFDLWFLIHFTKFLGVVPDHSKIKNIAGYLFDPKRGSFVLSKNEHDLNLWNLKTSAILYDFLCKNVEDLENFSLSYDDYPILIENMLKYYAIHISDFNYKKLISVYTELL